MALFFCSLVVLIDLSGVASLFFFASNSKAGSHRAAAEQGLVRSEGRDYAVQDGDVMLFRHNA